MASATGIPEQSFANEQEPLLGRPGDASQGDEPIYRNLVIGESPEPYTMTRKLKIMHRHRCCRASRSLDPGGYRLGSSFLARSDAVLSTSCMSSLAKLDHGKTKADRVTSTSSSTPLV